jgi:hypothetical protein
MPSLPANGARMVFFAMVARMPSALACACLSVASVASSSACETVWFSRSFRLRSALSRGRAQLRLLGRRVELHQQVALLHRCAGFKGDFRDRAADLRGHGHALRRAHRADGGERVRPAFLVRHGGRDGFHLRRGHAVDELFYFEHLGCCQNAAHDGHDDDSDE